MSSDSEAAERTACRVSVLIVNYKAYEELVVCLASLASGSLEDKEVIVVDHATDPARLDIVRAAHDDVRFLPTPQNLGFGGGMNAGARDATGAYLLVLNPDATVTPDAVPTLCDYLDSHPHVGIVGARVLDADGTVQRSARRFPTLLTGLFGRTSLMTRLFPDNPMSRRDMPGDRSVSAPLRVDWVAGSCLMIRTSLFRELGGFDEGFFLYWEDADLCRRARDAGWLTAYVPGAQVRHLVGRSSRQASARSIRAFHWSAMRYLVKHRESWVDACLLPFAGVALLVRMLVLMIAANLRQIRTRGQLG